MDHKIANRFIVGGIAVAVASIVLMKMGYSGVIGSMLNGAEIIEIGVEARWPFLAGLALMFWGIYRRINSN